MLDWNASFFGCSWRALLDSLSLLIRHSLATVQDVRAWSYDEGKSSDDRRLKADQRLLR